MMCIELEQLLRRKDMEEIVGDELLGNVRKEGQKFKSLVVETFYVHCKTGLYTMKFHLFDHVLEDLDRVRSVELLNIPAF